MSLFETWQVVPSTQYSTQGHYICFTLFVTDFCSLPFVLGLLLCLYCLCILYVLNPIYTIFTDTMYIIYPYMYYRWAGCKVLWALVGNWNFLCLSSHCSPHSIHAVERPSLMVYGWIGGGGLLQESRICKKKKNPLPMIRIAIPLSEVSLYWWNSSFGSNAHICVCMYIIYGENSFEGNRNKDLWVGFKQVSPPPNQNEGQGDNKKTGMKMYNILW